MKTRDKDKIKAVFDFVKSLTKKEVTQTFEVLPGIKSKISYWLLFDGYTFETDLQSETITLSNEFKKVFTKLFGYHDAVGEMYDIEYTKLLNLEALDRDFKKLYKYAGLDDDDRDWFTDDCMWTWTDWWISFTEPEPEPVVRLNSQYSAIINKDLKLVEVGCQKIPIDKVREIIAEYDKD